MKPRRLVLCGIVAASVLATALGQDTGSSIRPEVKEGQAGSLQQSIPAAQVSGDTPKQSQSVLGSSAEGGTFPAAGGQMSGQSFMPVPQAQQQPQQPQQASNMASTSEQQQQQQRQQQAPPPLSSAPDQRVASGSVAGQASTGGGSNLAGQTAVAAPTGQQQPLTQGGGGGGVGVGGGGADVTSGETPKASDSAAPASSASTPQPAASTGKILFPPLHIRTMQTADRLPPSLSSHSLCRTTRTRGGIR